MHLKRVSKRRASKVLKEVIKLIIEGKITNTQDIAHDLGIQIGTLNDMIQMLIRNGYLKTNTCDDRQAQSCASCSHSTHCGMSSSPVTTFIVTEKGMRWIGRDIQ
ncbi:MAG: hypothetical protein GF411_12325 [Candidatus Lokiarchaeota archaeon]|nr:hypothetical protein [Candidatus Lokiarchaeota archaeon]